MIMGAKVFDADFSYQRYVFHATLFNIGKCRECNEVNYDDFCASDAPELIPNGMMDITMSLDKNDFT